ncbi:glycosyl transferase family 2 [Microbacteriaceae bacterium MWH-Ta3]|nr:glycosyl transferase family 2 [Microbacteriaceae bacterium MWH-Ta3]
MKTVSIVIPAYNEEDTIRTCLLAALAQTVPAHEIIVVNNMSTDATVDIVRELQAANPDAPLVLIEQSAAQGITPTRNAGFDAATGDVIGRIDSDSAIEPNWVEEVAKSYADDSVAATTGPVLYYDMPFRRFGLIADDTLRRAMFKLTDDYQFLFGTNMAIRRDVWEAVRDETCMDEENLMHEDLDLAVHVNDAGYTISYVPTMVAGMSARRMDDSPTDFAAYAKRIETTYNHHGVRSRALMIPRWAYLAIYPLVKGMRWGVRAANAVR